MDDFERLRSPEEETVQELPGHIGAPVARSTGADVGDVRVHTGLGAEATAERLGARAIAFGRDIFLGKGEQANDLALIAHEVAHVIQQDAGPRVPLFGGERGFEREADATAHAVLGGRSARVSGRTGGPRVQRQPKGKQMSTPPPPQPVVPAPARANAAEDAFRQILTAEFPLVAKNWLAGTRSTTAGASLTPLPAGPGKSVVDVGSGFAPDTAAATLAAKAPAVRVLVASMLGARLGQGILTGDDIQVPLVAATLRAMTPLELRALRGRDKVEPAARDEIDRILAITTVIPAAANIGKDGAATLQVGGVTVKILPDKRDGTENETGYELVPSGVETPGCSFGSDGKVSAIKGPMPVVPTVVIQTTYAAAGKASTPDPLTAHSVYGRGTVPGDQGTSLRFHESSHGADYLDYLAAHPYRPFEGAIGMTAREWSQEQKEFIADHRAWNKGIGHFSLCNTDCVGTSIDTFHKGEKGYKLQCTSCNKKKAKKKK